MRYITLNPSYINITVLLLDIEKNGIAIAVTQIKKYYTVPWGSIVNPLRVSSNVYRKQMIVCFKGLKPVWC